MTDDILKRIAELVAEGEDDDAVEAVREAIASGIPPMEVLNEGAAKGMDIVSKQYDEGEAFLPELVLAGDAMSAVLQVIFEGMSAEDVESSVKGSIVLGQAFGDVHDIGKNVVGALLAVNGFKIYDLGTNVPVKAMIEKAKEVNADMIGMSTLLTTSLPYMDDAVRYLEDTGNRQKYFVIVGGGPVTPEFATKIGADGWARNAFDAVELCKRLMADKKPAQGDLVVVDSEA